MREYRDRKFYNKLSTQSNYYHRQCYFRNQDHYRYLIEGKKEKKGLPSIIIYPTTCTPTIATVAAAATTNTTTIVITAAAAAVPASWARYFQMIMMGTVLIVMGRPGRRPMRCGFCYLGRIMGVSLYKARASLPLCHLFSRARVNPAVFSFDFPGKSTGDGIFDPSSPL